MTDQPSRARQEALKLFRDTKKKSLGTIIIEADGSGWLIMFPDGEVVGARNRKSAERKARVWFQKHTGDAIGIGVIEWRV